VPLRICCGILGRGEFDHGLASGMAQGCPHFRAAVGGGVGLRWARDLSTDPYGNDAAWRRSERVRTVRRFGNVAEMAQGAAESILGVAREAIAARGRFMLALSGGATPVYVFRAMVANVARREPRGGGVIAQDRYDRKNQRRNANGEERQQYLSSKDT